MRCVCSYLCVWALCVQILAPPLVQCTYIGPTVHIHNFLLCFKSIYFLKRPPPPLLLPPSAKAGLTRLTRQPQMLWDCCAEAFSRPSGCCFGEDGEGLFSGKNWQTFCILLICCTRGIFDEVTWGLLKYRLVNRQDLLMLIRTSALKCILWSLMNSISV